MKRTILYLTAALTLVTAVSCATVEPYNQTGYERVQVIDVFDKNKMISLDDQVPLSSIIQPSELKLSPVIDIETLKIIDTDTANVSASTVKQEEKKNEITEALANGEAVDTTLHDDYDVTTSGALALEATEKSFRFINTPTAFNNSIAVYDFIPNMIYEIITSPGKITDFTLRPGEQIAGAPIVNDTANWTFSMGTSIEDGESVQHLFITPRIAGLDTSMIVLTNERTYRFRMASFENQYMTGLYFMYPQQVSGGYVSEDFDEYTYDTSTLGAYTLDLSKVDYGYKVKIAKGKPSWSPVSVFSDGVKTYIQMPVTIANDDSMPSIYLVKNGDENLVNYRIIGNLYQVDTVLSDKQYFSMKSGQKERVEIRKGN